MKRVIFAASLALPMVFALPAFAVDPVRESYLSLYGGLTIPQESDIKSADGTDTGTLEFDNGFAVGAAAGYNWGGPRFEIEIGYRSFEASSLKNVTVNGAAFSGSSTGSIDLSLLTVLGNVLYEFATDSPFTPYVGLGIGVGFIEASGNGWVSTGTIGGTTTIVRRSWGGGSDDTVFAYQGIIGGKMQLSDTTSAFVDYRYVGTSEADFDGVSGSVSAHNINAGFMFSFSPVPNR